MKKKLLLSTILIGCVCISAACTGNKKGIKPWTKNPAYWQYQGNPVLLLGASNGDNLFQAEDLESQLNTLASVGGNYIRNTMSDRDDGDLKAFAKNPDGKYDLNQWNKAYWQRFRHMLELTSKRDIIVQIEIWDRFDHTDQCPVPPFGIKDLWQADPYNPDNNINYTYEETNFAKRYDAHPGANKQAFFFTVPELHNSQVVLQYQEAFVKKLLSITLKYDHVLYCIDNETSGVEEWSAYWARFLRSHSSGKEICITEMWDHWDVTSPTHKRTIDHPEIYDFIDLSQNSHNTGHRNWTNAQGILDYIQNSPRPVNSTKVYGNDNSKWKDRGITTDHAVHTVCRNIMGGYASSRFHRPPVGTGICEASLNCIKTIREIEKNLKIWELNTVLDFSEDQENEAYLRKNDGGQTLIYLPRGGKATLHLENEEGRFALRWISTDDASWSSETTLQGGANVELKAPGTRSCFALISLNR